MMRPMPTTASSSGTIVPAERKRLTRPESSRMTSPTPDAALALASAALGAEPAGLLTDLDGTLAPIVADPAAVALEAGAETALRALAGRLAVTGIVTGRAAADARAIAGVPQLLVVGNHGLEWLEPMADQPTPAPEFDWAPGALGRLIDEVRAAVPIRRRDIRRQGAVGDDPLPARGGPGRGASTDPGVARRGGP